MANQPTRTKGNGSAGGGSERRQRRAPAKKAAAKARRAEDTTESALVVHQRSGVCRGYACPTCDFLEDEEER